LHHAIFDTMHHYGSSHTLLKMDLKVSFKKVHNEHQHTLGVYLELNQAMGLRIMFLMLATP
jgi:hypothetical protein